MKEQIIGARNALIHSFYAGIMKPIFFRYDPESIHDTMTRFGATLGKRSLTRAVTRSLFGYADPRLAQTILGISFKNPVGLAAGFDKNAELTDILPSVGFGFIEVGSITGKPCEGNAKPRVWRLPKSKALVINYGLKNDGCDVIARRLKEKRFEAVIGTSVAMTNCAENVDIVAAIHDYVKAFRSLADIGDYFTINISCPNAQGGQPFVEAPALDRLLAEIDAIETSKPVFIKLSPDMSVPQVDALLEVAKKHRVHGIIVVNLTKKRDNPKILDKDVPAAGGVSGKPVSGMSDGLLSYIYKKERDRFVLVGVGGIFTAEDAYKKIRLGASLVQLITGMIYEGPQLIGEINRGLAQLLARDGFKTISEARGIDVK